MNKRYKQIALILVILSVIATLTRVSATDNNNTHITSSDLYKAHISPDGDDNFGDGSWENPFNSIGYAINYTSDDSTVHLNDGKYCGENNRNIALNKSVTLI